MASIPQFAILLAVSLCIISISEARPCKTFFISSYSFSVLRHQNPNSPHLLRPSGFVTVFAEFSQPDRSSFPSSEIVPPRRFPSSDGGDEVESEIVRPPFRLRPNEPPFGAGFQPEFSYDFTSLRDRTKDIMSVVVALLFGVGCGALTAATMYLAYSLFSTRFQNRSSLHEGYGDGDEDDGNYRADDSDLKKMGYVKIPAESTPATVKAVTHNYSIDADSSTIARDSGFQNSLYGCVQDASEQVDPTTPTRTFVKVYKSGSVGRSLDISRVNSYHELRAELAHIFGIEGKLEDLLTSGWRLVYVDRENDVLLLEEDPWEEFVNNVWCIRILSPEEVQKMAEL